MKFAVLAALLALFAASNPADVTFLAPIGAGVETVG